MTRFVDGGLPVPERLTRGAHRDREEWVASGRFAIDLIRSIYGSTDLGSASLLDVGCGTKLAKLLHDDAVAIGRYVGIDVSGEVISWLRAHISDPRFEFHHIDVRNDLYNPSGTPLGQLHQLPVETNAFDVICLFSVFTHLDPEDFESMLRILRPHVRSGGRLVFSVFLFDRKAAPAQLADALEQALSSGDEKREQLARAAIERALRSDPPRFLDEDPARPLLRARYATDYALELIERTGWHVESLHPPVRPYIQHYFVCSPS